MKLPTNYKCNCLPLRTYLTLRLDIINVFFFFFFLVNLINVSKCCTTFVTFETNTLFHNPEFDRLIDMTPLSAASLHKNICLSCTKLVHNTAQQRQTTTSCVLCDTMTDDRTDTTRQDRTDRHTRPQTQSVQSSHFSLILFLINKSIWLRVLRGIFFCVCCFACSMRFLSYFSWLWDVRCKPVFFL